MQVIGGNQTVKCVNLIKGMRPGLKDCPASIDRYDVIYPGYPNYWGTMPAAVFSFLERYDFTGKILKPSYTHEGGGMGRSERNLKRACPGTRIASRSPVQGSRIKQELSAIADNYVIKWNTKEKREYL